MRSLFPLPSTVISSFAKEMSERLRRRSSDALTAVLYRHSTMARSRSDMQEDLMSSTSSEDIGFLSFF